MEDRFMQTRAELKQEAKNLLKGHWGKAIGLNILQILPLLLGLFVVVGIGSNFCDHFTKSKWQLY